MRAQSSSGVDVLAGVVAEFVDTSNVRAFLGDRLATGSFMMRWTARCSNRVLPLPLCLASSFFFRFMSSYSCKSDIFKVTLESF